MKSLRESLLSRGNSKPSTISAWDLESICNKKSEEEVKSFCELYKIKNAEFYLDLYNLVKKYDGKVISSNKCYDFDYKRYKLKSVVDMTVEFKVISKGSTGFILNRNRDGETSTFCMFKTSPSAADMKKLKDMINVLKRTREYSVAEVFTNAGE